MAELTQDGDRAATGATRATGTTAATTSREAYALRRRVCLVVAVVVLVWSVVELGNLVMVHTIGPELYGVLVAALAVAGGIAGVILLRSSERRFWLSAGIVALWAFVALGGLAGMIAHIVGPVAGHGPIDTRPRPVAAPLIFTLLGVVGGAALFFGQRLHAGASVPEPGEE